VIVSGGGQLGGRVAIVTGGAQGIGRCIAEFLARDGASVLIADIQAKKSAKAAQELSAAGHDVTSYAADITDPDTVDELVTHCIERSGCIDILVNNAGIDAPTGFATELSREHWREVVETDLTGPWWCTQAVIPHMMERRYGRIIFISSRSWQSGSANLSVAYNAAKAGLVGLTIGLSVQLEPFGILVNAIAPGPTGTGRGAVSDADAVNAGAVFPLGIAGPEPVAHACLYLARESGDWISGTVLNVSGGRWRG
jgi:3-oxoacyl-[acyl-carrier protein] reductase